MTGAGFEPSFLGLGAACSTTVLPVAQPTDGITQEDR
jgi:hypothetical protein